MLLRQTLFNLAIAAVVEAIFVRISVKQVPPLHKVTALYLKLVMSSNFWPFMYGWQDVKIQLLTLIVPFAVYQDDVKCTKEICRQLAQMEICSQ